jgi:hypothetical protein
VTTNLSDVVDLLHPTVSGVGVITTDQLFIVFDRAMDESSIEAGNFFTTGPDQDTFMGPALGIYEDFESVGSEDEILQSPALAGIVQGTISFERLSLSSLDVVSGIDTVGSGHLYRTKAILTPTQRLQPDTDYLVYLSGDEDATDSLRTGVSSRTVFDTLASGANVTTADVTFEGGYDSLSITSDVYHVSITASGQAGDALFEFYRESDENSVFGPFKTRRAGTLLSDGVTVVFGNGTYEVDDAWQVSVKSPDFFLGNLVWPFKTGSGSIETIPTTTSTTVIGDIPTSETISATVAGTSTFSVSSTDPADEATSIILPATSFPVTVDFNADIDASTATTSNISVFVEAVTGDLDVPASGLLLPVHVTPTVTDDELEIVIASGILKQNNLVTITLDSSIADTDGTTLGSDYEFWFTTQYYPLFSTVRRVRLDIGQYIQDVADDTVNLAIHIASLEADALTWNRDNLTDAYFKFVRQQWTTCRAEEILLTNTIGGAGSLRSKKLGDLEVQYDTSGRNATLAIDRALACMARWEGALLAGGRQVHEAVMVVRGELDVDRPPIGRGWAHSRDLHNPQVPAANRRVRLQSTRRFRNLYTRLSGRPGWLVKK